MYKLRVLHLEDETLFDDGFSYAYELHRGNKLISKYLFIDNGQSMDEAIKQAKNIIFNTTGIKLY